MRLFAAVAIFITLLISLYPKTNRINLSLFDQLDGTWASSDKGNRLGQRIIISKDSIYFDNKFHHKMKFKFYIDSITNQNHFWISVDNVNDEVNMKFCLIRSFDCLYISTLKGKSGISDHFTDCYLYIKENSSNNVCDLSNIEEVEIFITGNIPLKNDCNLLHSTLSNIFYIAFDQTTPDKQIDTDISFNKYKFMKTSHKADLRALYHEKYKIYYADSIIPVIYIKGGIKWKSYLNVDDIEKEYSLKNDSWVAIVGRFNPDRNYCNKIFGEKIEGQVQNFEIVKWSCFLERLN